MADGLKVSVAEQVESKKTAEPGIPSKAVIAGLQQEMSALSGVVNQVLGQNIAINDLLGSIFDPKGSAEARKDNEQLKIQHERLATGIATLSADGHCVSYKAADWVLRKDWLGDALIAGAAVGAGYGLYKVGEMAVEFIIDQL